MRVPTRIPGLDELLEGGFPAGTVNLVCGPAGSAKSLFTMQYVCGLDRDAGEKGAIITLEESRESLLRASRAFSFDLEGLEDEGLITILDLGAMRASTTEEKELQMDLVSFGTLLETTMQLKRDAGVTRLALDSLSAVGLYYKDDDTYRRELFRFSRKIKESGVTTLLIGESSQDGHTQTDVEQFIADSMIFLGYRSVKGEYRRTLTVHKMRYTRHDPYKHPFLITPDGIEVDFEEVIFE